MDTVQEFSYRLAPVRGPVHYRVSGQRVEQLDSDGHAKRELDLSRVQSARWMEVPAGKRLIVRSLSLKTDNGSFNIDHTCRLMAPPSDPDVAAHLATVSSALAALSKVRPDVGVALGRNAFLRWFNFIVIMGVAGMLLIPMSSVFDRYDTAKWWWLIAFLAGCIGVSLFFALRNPPWRPSPEQPAAELAASIGARLQ